MICDVCGNEFIKTGRNQRYCNDCRKACGIKAVNEYKARMKPEPATRVCPVCGKAFTATRHNVTCSRECSHERVLEQQRIRNQAEREKRLEEKLPRAKRTRKEKKLDLDGVIKQAHDAGLTYADMQRAKSLEMAGRIDTTLGGMF